MKIQMLDTVEDSHMYMGEIIIDDKGTKKMHTFYDVQKFYKGEQYDHEKLYPDWTRRATKFVDMGLAEQVTAEEVPAE